MAGTTATDWIEIQQLMVERYPDLPQHEAYVELLRDAFIRFPKEVMGIVFPVLPHLSKQLPEIMQEIGKLTNRPGVSSTGTIAGILRDAMQSANASKRVASELKGFNNPSLSGQIANINALITSSAAVYYIKKNGRSSREDSERLRADWGPHSL